jgi:imidazole glycerol-phosphate synthase subunit HisF
MLNAPKHPIRLIARLDIKGENVVKGVQLEGLRVVGKPSELAHQYYQDGADELIYMDIVASLYGRNNILSEVRNAAQDIFVPLTVGGGIRNDQDIKAALRSGADKVAINTQAIRNPEFISEAANLNGSQAVVVSIEAKRRAPNKWEALVDNGREKTGFDVVEWAERAETLGAGEILLTSVDNEGTRKGLDHDLFSAVRNRVSIPVIGCGGSGTVEDIAQAVNEDGLDAIAVASLFHYNVIGVEQMKSELAQYDIEVRQ